MSSRRDPNDRRDTVYDALGLDPDSTPDGRGGTGDGRRASRRDKMRAAKAGRQLTDHRRRLAQDFFFYQVPTVRNPGE
jgi:hypothetical protein